MKVEWIVLCVLIHFLTACATSPTGRSQLVFMPDDQLNSMGLQAFEDLKKEKPISQDVKENTFVRCIANAITREVGGNWEVTVFEDKSLNAFALPGSKIGVHTGLIDLVDNQHQLAAVIGHEIGHVLARHSNERMSQKVAQPLLQRAHQVGIALAGIAPFVVADGPDGQGKKRTDPEREQEREPQQAVRKELTGQRHSKQFATILGFMQC